MTISYPVMRVPLATWMHNNPIPADNRLATLAKDILGTLQGDVTACMKEFRPGAEITVLGKIEQDGLKLPVVELYVPGLARLFARDNLDEWAVTVDAMRPVRDLDTIGLDVPQADDTRFSGFLESGVSVYAGYVPPAMTQFSLIYPGTMFPDIVRRILTAIR